MTCHGGQKVYLVWPFILFLGIEHMPTSCTLAACRPPCTLGPRDPAHSPLVFTGHKRQHLLLTPRVLLPPGPQKSPLEVVMLGITSAAVLLSPFLGVSSFLGSVSLLCGKAQFAVTTCVITPLPPGPFPRYYHYLIGVTAIITTLICEVIHTTEQCSCCFLCLNDGELRS